MPSSRSDSRPIGRSPNTVKAYAHDLKDFLGFLGVRGLDWRDVRLEDVGEFVAWLRLPPPGRAGAAAGPSRVRPEPSRHAGGNVRVAPDDGGLRSVT